jgi:DNA-binding HxlR family transcriptional regulator
MAQDTEKQGNTSSAPASVARMVEDIVGCKWSLAVLAAIRKDIARPGAIRRSLAGISTKVLNERLVKMLRYGLLVKQIYPEVPPRVEYGLTPFGERFVVLLDQIEALQAQVDAARTDAPGPKR